MKIGKITQEHPALFVNAYLVADWLMENAGSYFDCEQEEVENLVAGFIEEVENDNDGDD